MQKKNKQTEQTAVAYNYNINPSFTGMANYNPNKGENGNEQTDGGCQEKWLQFALTNINIINI